MNPRLEKIYTEYSRFNAARSLGIPEESRFRTARVGGSVAHIDDARPAPGFANRVLGLALPDLDRLPGILALYGSRRPQFDLAPEHIETPTVDALMHFGYRPWLSLTYLKATPQFLPESAPEIKIERWGPDRADDFLALLNRTVDEPFSTEIWQTRRHHYGTETFRTYVAWVKNEPAAWATLFVHGGGGILANAYTFEPFRGRGCHTALLRHRLNESARLALTQVYTDVVPGTPSVDNCRRAGFEHATTNTLWHPDRA